MRTQRILVVDDEPEILRIIEWALTSAGYEAVTAYSAERAIGIAERQHFDLILTDLAMPRMDGREFVQQLRANQKNRRVPIVIVTAHQWADLAARAMAEGCDGMIHKPFTATELRQQVAKFLRSLHYEDGTADPRS